MTNTSTDYDYTVVPVDGSEDQVQLVNNFNGAVEYIGDILGAIDISYELSQGGVPW